MDVELVHEIVKPLQEKLERFFPEDEAFMDLEDASSLRISTLSDVMVKVILEFSYNGVDKGVCTQVRATSIWLSQKIDVPMRYLRLHVVNESQQVNTNLVVVLRLVGRTKTKKAVFKSPVVEVKEEPAKETPREFVPLSTEGLVPQARGPPMIKQGSALVEHQDVVEEVKQATRASKSPFARFRKKTDSQPSVKAVPIKDPRLPEYLPAGSLLVCGIGSTLKLLPKGNDGEYLMMVDGEPRWTLPFPPRLLSDESKLRLSHAIGSPELELEETSDIPEPWVIRD